jgi:hypothetical protein
MGIRIISVRILSGEKPATQLIIISFPVSAVKCPDKRRIMILQPGFFLFYWLYGSGLAFPGS